MSLNSRLEINKEEDEGLRCSGIRAFEVKGFVLVCDLHGCGEVRIDQVAHDDQA